MAGSDQVIGSAGGIASAGGFGSPEVWITSNFAQEWLCDTCLASMQEGRRYRRIEIVSAVCFAESYLFEFVRDAVLQRNFRPLDKYFDPNRHQGVKDRFTTVLNALKKDNKITDLPDWNKPFWREFHQLVNLRDGLVHGAFSRPHRSDLRQRTMPKPTVDDFYKISPEWAMQVVISVCKELHCVTSHLIPEWVLDPHSLLQSKIPSSRP